MLSREVNMTMRKFPAGQAGVFLWGTRVGRSWFNHLPHVSIIILTIVHYTHIICCSNEIIIPEPHKKVMSQMGHKQYFHQATKQEIASASTLAMKDEQFSKCFHSFGTTQVTQKNGCKLNKQNLTKPKKCNTSSTRNHPHHKVNGGIYRIWKSMEYCPNWTDLLLCRRHRT